jgi:hypothetical protein
VRPPEARTRWLVALLAADWMARDMPGYTKLVGAMSGRLREQRKEQAPWRDQASLPRS